MADGMIKEWVNEKPTPNLNWGGCVLSRLIDPPLSPNPQIPQSILISPKNLYKSILPPKFQFAMTETASMKDPIKSFDVFDFKEEDELPVNNIAPNLRYPHALDVASKLAYFGNDIAFLLRSMSKLKENDIAICGGANVDFGNNRDAADSFAPSQTDDFAKETPEWNHVLHCSFEIHNQAKENKSVIIESCSVVASVECGSTLGAALQLEDNLNVAIPESFGSDRSVQLASDADENLIERSPSAFANNFAPCDGSSSGNCGPLSGNCSHKWNSVKKDLVSTFSAMKFEVSKIPKGKFAHHISNERDGIVFYPDYVDYCGTHYLDSVVSFSQRFVEARSKSAYSNERIFQIRLEIEDIVKIESQWSARSEAGTISIYSISKDGVQGGLIHNASVVCNIHCYQMVALAVWRGGLLANRHAKFVKDGGLQELKFPAVDSDWYQKQEAIGSLDMRYKALWNVLLDTGMEKISPLPEGKEMRRTRSYFPKFDQPFEEVIYPKGDPDAVSISKRDVDLLLPDTFVNDTIIDFYIKYLKSRQNEEARSRFHFFNSFFFRKLADMDKDPSSAFDGKAAFQRVRKWTRKINLLEKDFIFIPVNYNYHWSLIVICYFGEVSSYEGKILLILDCIENGKTLRVPCILHMDSLRGTHAGLKDLLQSYLWEEWKERQKETSEDMCSSFRNLKFLPLELPQQPNSYDCGLFLLHYVELFLEEVPDNFSVYKITPSSKFLQADWFPPGEASMKRTHIERLINDLLDTQSEDFPGGSGMHASPEPNATLGHANGVEFSIKSSISAQIESSLLQVDPTIEMTLLPASSTRGTQCNRASGVVLKELFKQASGPESLSDAPWGALESGQSLHEFNRPDPLTEEANECLAQQELEEPVFQSMDDEPVFTYSSEDFRLDTFSQPVHNNVCMSPVTSGSESDDIVEVEVDNKNWQSVMVLGQYGEIDSHNRCSSPEKIEQPDSEKNAEINNSNGDESFILKEFCPEAKQMHDEGPSHESLPVDPSLASGDKLDALEGVIQCDGEHPHRLGHDVLELGDEERTPKRMRIARTDDNANNYLSDDLHL
ncbi:sentrin-specific protease [Striga asiatica]|uniref:Sentrin-specific protease n=1 Tax=Striga asiatica TaxID=4170 RepID=A0A5A7QRF5_STRAF|nr:sentrin-specific protease [Striga asiatica]